MKANVELLSPKECEKLLKNNNSNRPIRHGAVRRYAGQMHAGKWRVNGEPIIIGSDGQIIDGQHRLLACVESGVALRTLVVRDVDPTVFSTVDTGASRNSSDVLVIKGFAPAIAKTAGSAAALSIVFEHHGTGSVTKGSQISHLITPQACSDWIMERPRMVQIVEAVHNFGHAGRIFPAGQSAFLWYYMEKKNPTGTIEFFEGFLSGANLPDKDARLVLRNRLIALKSASVSWNQQARMGAVVRAWDWFSRGRDVNYPSNLYRTDTLSSALELLLPSE